MARMTEGEYKQLVKQLIEKYELTSEQGEILEHALHYIHLGHSGLEIGEGALTLAETSSKVAHFVHTLTIGGAASESAIASAAGGGVTLAIIGPVLSVLGALGLIAMIIIETIDAVSLASRYYGLYANAYTITAWSFGYGIPLESRAFLDRQKQALYPVFDSRSYQRAWHEESWKTLNKLEKAANEYGKRAIQGTLCGVCRADPKKLCLAVLCASAAKFRQGSLEQQGFRGYFSFHPTESSFRPIIYPS